MNTYRYQIANSEHELVAVLVQAIVTGSKTATWKTNGLDIAVVHNGYTEEGVDIDVTAFLCAVAIHDFVVFDGDVCCSL